MPITVYWNNDSNTPCTLRPAPLVSISLNVNKNSAGEAFGATYSITLTGTILADRGNPFGAYSIPSRVRTHFIPHPLEWGC